MTKVNLKKNILMSGSFRLLIILVTFLGSWISARYLGVELKGKLSYLYTMSGFIWMVLDAGLSRSFPYLIRKYPEKTSSLFMWSLAMFITETVILSVLGLSLINYWNEVFDYQFNSLYMICFVGLITFTKYSHQLQFIYLGLDNVFIYSISNLISAALTLAMLTVGYFFAHNTDRLTYVLIAGLTALITSIIVFLRSNKWGKWWRDFDLRFIFTSYKSGFRIFLSSLFTLLLIRFDVIIIRKMLGFADVGIYSIAAHIVDLLQLASNLVGGLLLVKLSDTEDDTAKWIVMKKLLIAFFVFLTIANVGFIVCGKFILATMFGIQFVPVYFAYLWLIPASYGLSFGSLFNNYLNSKGFPIISIILPAVALIVNILLNFMLIPVLGIYGSALATSIAYLLWFIMIILYEQKSTQGKLLRYLIPERSDWIEFYTVCSSIISNAYRRTKRINR